MIRVSSCLCTCLNGTETAKRVIYSEGSGKGTKQMGISSIFKKKGLRG